MRTTPRRRARLELALLLSLVAVALGSALPASGAAPEKGYAVATESPGATREAARVLDAGGNAFDAIVCAALVSGFTNPASSGLGGGGFAMVYSAREQRPLVFDFREVAPAGLDEALLADRPVPADKRGHTVGVPGEVSGLFELHQRYGKLRWKDVVGRAARLAAQGFVLEPFTSQQVAEQQTSPIARSASFRGAYLPQGTPAPAGTKLRATKLAATLRHLADQGKRGFYEGRVARDMVDAVAAAGGALALTDLAEYRTVQREPLRVSWEGKEIATMPAPSAGGLLLAQTLALFSKAELTELAATPGKRLHLLAEAMRGAFADRIRHLGDPAFTPVDMSKLLSAPRLQRRKAGLSAERTHTQPRYGLEEQGTHQLVAADAEGNWVALTTTVNAPFGAKIVAEQSGIILNNELEDFTPAKSAAVFGMTDNPNRPRKGARPVSSMAPTLVLEDGVPTLALGGSGGLTIGPNVTQVALRILAEGASVEAAVAAPRFSIPPPQSGYTLSLEKALGERHEADLQGRGELVSTRDWKNAVQAVTRQAGTFAAAADPRKHGSALVRNSAAQ